MARHYIYTRAPIIISRRAPIIIYVRAPIIIYTRAPIIIYTRGLYIVEDVEMSYWSSGWFNPTPPGDDFVTLLKRSVDAVNREFFNASFEAISGWAIED